ncbi:hypothetical protein E2C01_017560 [Portunus trituberculatus]|uniref:Uncharacterized protein n=1 Tax=Portunus trituberculatus TaxID=210409 RepID=A0A5B7DTT9_PORTR|nr:hypothetical protein [Portunus trituberculatus]
MEGVQVEEILGHIKGFVVAWEWRKSSNSSRGSTGGGGSRVRPRSEAAAERPLPNRRAAV